MAPFCTFDQQSIRPIMAAFAEPLLRMRAMTSSSWSIASSRARTWAPAAGLAQQEAGAPDDHLDLVGDLVPHHLVEPQRARHVVDDGQHVGAERVLQLGVLVEVVQHDLRDGVPPQDDDQALAGAVAGLVPDVGDAADLAVLDQLGDLLGQRLGVDLERELGDDSRSGCVDLVDVDDGPMGTLPRPVGRRP